MTAGCFYGSCIVPLRDSGFRIPSHWVEAWLKAYPSPQGVITVAPGGPNTRPPWLALYPLAVYEEMERKLLFLNRFNKEVHALKRLFIGHAEDTSIGQDGRLIISPRLCQYAGITDRLVLIGNRTYIEIAAPE